MNLIEICDLLIARKLIKNQTAFAVLIGRTPGFLSDAKAGNVAVTLSVWVRVWFKLLALHQFDLAQKVFDIVAAEAAVDGEEKGRLKRARAASASGGCDMSAGTPAGSSMRREVAA